MKTNTVNLDKDEVAKFEALAFRWWDPNGPMKTLHQINPLRVSFLQQQLNLHGKHLIDIGCGGGIFSEALARLVGPEGQVTGLDASASCIQVAQAHAAQSDLKINYQHTTAEVYVEGHAQTADIVTCMELIEHVPDPQALIQACASLLKPGGTFLISTLNRTPKAFLQAILGAEYVLGWLPKGTHHYKSFIRPSEICKWGAPFGLEPQESTGIEYSILRDKFELGKDLSVNYILSFKNTAMA